MIEEKRYGQWAGEPKGRKQNPNNCIAEVCSNYIFYQCSKKKAIGDYCKQHHKKRELKE